ncbi:MAG: thiolase family protein [Gammaproteobacteria bacterium]|nr:thiolase family protein [Gammaproteobacteria bacterium]
MSQAIAEIPYGCYWSTPFFKWQGNIQNLHPLKFAAWVAKNELEKRDISPDTFDHGILGTSVPQQKSFYGLPWLASGFGAENLAGPTIAQACATGVRCIATADQEIQMGLSSSVFIVTADRTSNGPHIYYPNPSGPGGTGIHENWVMDNFNVDPLGGHPMVQTAENVAKKHNITLEQQHDVVLQRLEQYQQAIADEYAFQKRYMTLPFDVPHANFKKIVTTVQGDEGITFSTPEGLAKLRPVMPEGSVTFGGQTYPADGNAAMIMTTPDKAKELSTDSSIVIKVLSYGQARCERAYMPEATIPAAKAALKNAELEIRQIDAFKSHNPFAVNDLVFAKEMGVDLSLMNNYGCSLIWGHPQGPTGLRSVIELIEELVIKGGGTGMFFGCAAGDSAMALIIQVESR